MFAEPLKNVIELALTFGIAPNQISRLNDLFYFIKDTQLLNFADDKTIVTFSNSVDDFITELQKESENTIGFARTKW